MAAPSQYLTTAIEATHQAIVHEPDPAHKQTLGQCLTQMLKLQAEMAGKPGGPPGMGGPPGAPPGMGGPPPGMGGPPPAGPQAAPAQLAMLQALGR